VYLKTIGRHTSMEGFSATIAICGCCIQLACDWRGNIILWKNSDGFTRRLQDTRTVIVFISYCLRAIA
jgi:hypothetical protein